jgi:hypothetical protein
MAHEECRRQIPEPIHPVMVQGILNLAIDGLFTGPAAEGALAMRREINANYDQWLKDFWGG